LTSLRTARAQVVQRVWDPVRAPAEARPEATGGPDGLTTALL
jgi:hypothetical protein